jgi:hypothetical protein
MSIGTAGVAMEFEAIAPFCGCEPAGFSFERLPDPFAASLLIDAQVTDSSEASLHTDLRNAMHRQKSDHFRVLPFADEEVFIVVIQEQR